jgi:hypothetical protein
VSAGAAAAAAAAAATVERVKSRKVEKRLFVAGSFLVEFMG